ncbi:MAG TPA: PLP-dependent aspartate aminotransferase family protein [Pyrinomonadaceae bacterium]|nr:PLP-dependent aspartate aminotransferase family protein [Pyrinomonadaceae bacterium]
MPLNSYVPDDAQIETAALHSGTEPDPTTGAILTPIYQTTTYRQNAVGSDKGYTYSRAGNPTVKALEDRIATLEKAEHATCFSSGLAATNALFLTLLKAGDRVVVSDVCYGGTVRLLEQILTKFGVEADFVDTSDEAKLAESLQKPAALVFIETPANPTLKLTDIALAARLAHDAGALLAVDNTLLSPALQRPIELGADIVLESTTKFFDGHNATIGGALATSNAELDEAFKFTRKTIGSIQAPFDAWLTLQGSKTLPLRVWQQSENALAVAAFLKDHPRVKNLNYPGLPDFPQYELARRQQTAGGALLSFELHGGIDSGIALMNNVKLCSLAENLGSAETLITHPASMTHGSVAPEAREKAGITDGLVRLSVGLENPEDIIADLDRALSQRFVKGV